MPALLDRSIVRGGFMHECSHITNLDASSFVRTYGNDIARSISHNANMARRGIPKEINWFLREWMDDLEITQAEMMRRTGWSKASAHQLYHRQQDYSPKIVNDAAAALGVRKFELLMRPAEAKALRKAQEAKAEARPTPPEPKRRLKKENTTVRT